MSLTLLSYIYDSLVQFLGTDWLAWTVLFIAMLIVFSVLLRVPYMIVISVASLPFLLLGIYSVITLSSWIMFLVLFILGVILAISIYKIISR